MLGSRHRKSVVTDDMDRCFICGSYRNIEIHHIFGASERKLSEKFGLIVPLCHSCHNEPPAGVHHNADQMRWMHEVGQRAFEMQGHTREEFKEIFKRGTYL